MNFSRDNELALNSTKTIREVTTFGFVTFLVITIVLLPIGILGNLLVILVVKKKRYLQTRTNFLLANLAGTDLLANVLGYTFAAARTFPMPTRTIGEVLCKINSLFPAVSLCAILIFTLIALERYNAIVKPMSPGFKFTRRTLRYFIVVIWIVSIAAATPLVYFNNYNSDYQCTRTWSTSAQKHFWTTAFFIGIFLPLVALIYCYFRIIRTLRFGSKIIPMNIPLEVDTKEKKKVIRLSIVVTLVFFISYTPFAVVKEIEIRRPVPNEVKVFSLVFVLLSSFLNPFIYAFQSTNYRRALKEAIICRLLR